MSALTSLEDYPLAGKVEEAAEVLRCSPWTIYQGIKRGEIKAVRLGRSIRITRAELARLLGMERS